RRDKAEIEREHHAFGQQASEYEEIGFGVVSELVAEAFRGVDNGPASALFGVKQVRKRCKVWHTSDGRYYEREFTVMHEIRATVAPEHVAQATCLAREAGIQRVTVTDVYVHGPDARRQVVSVETSTPKARAFVEAFLASPELACGDCALTSRELRAIVD